MPRTTDLPGTRGQTQATHSPQALTGRQVGTKEKEVTKQARFDYTDYRKAGDYLAKKGIRTALQHSLRLFNLNQDGNLEDIPAEQQHKPNVLYVLAKQSKKGTPMSDADVQQAKEDGTLLAEIPFTDGIDDHMLAICKAAEIVKAKLGNVTLSDVVAIPEATRPEIRKLKTRLSKSSTTVDLDARKDELAMLISLYEEKENDTEREDLAEQYQSIREYLEDAQNSLEQDNKEDALSYLDDAIMAV